MPLNNIFETAMTADQRAMGLCIQRELKVRKRSIPGETPAVLINLKLPRAGAP